MIIPKEAIEKAIEGGWNDARLDYEATYADIALDHSFWQALGMALEWEGAIDRRPFATEWENYAHAFYHRILTGGDTQAFWDELLTNTTTS